MAKATNKPEYVVIHHTAVSYDKNPQQFSATNTVHKNKGFPKSTLGFYVGYTAMVEKNGDIKTARRDDELGAHTSQDSMNFRSVALCFTGNFDIEEPTVEQCRTALQWIQSKQQAWKIPDNKVLPHRHWAPKSCWGSKLPDDCLQYLRARVEAADDAPSPWAREAFQAAEKLGYSSSKPREIVGTARMRYILDKEYPALSVITIKDAPVTYEEYITAKWKGGAFN